MNNHVFQTPVAVEIPKVFGLCTGDNFGDFSMDKETIEAVPAAILGAVEGFDTYYMGKNMGLFAWGALAASIVVYDAYALTHKVPTLTRVAHEALNIHPLITRGAIGAVALHLAAPKLSPIDRLYDKLK